MTGRYPMNHGAFANHYPVRDTIVPLTTTLKDSGYDVVLAGKSHISPKRVFNFSYKYGMKKKFDLPWSSIKKHLKRAQSTRGKPLCLFVTSKFPHRPFIDSAYTVNDTFKKPYTQRADQSDMDIVSDPNYYYNIDREMGELRKLVKMVDRYDLRNNTMFIYASDNGLDGKWTVYEAGLRVPLVVRFPGVVKPGSSTDKLVSLMDILPTMLDFAEVPPSNYPPGVDGKSFRALLADPFSTRTHQYLYGFCTRQNLKGSAMYPSRAIIGETYKLIVHYNAKERLHETLELSNNPRVNVFIENDANTYPDVPYEAFYNLLDDPWEANNLLPRFGNLVDQFRALLQQHMTSQGDFLLSGRLPLLPYKGKPLDQPTKRNKVPRKYRGTLLPSDYMTPIHFRFELGNDDDQGEATSPCSDTPSPYMVQENYSCSSWEFMFKYACRHGDQEWKTKKYCQWSCARNSVGYDGTDC
jgi:uncharacterized sulfatase